jgi:hypothetical protein
MKDDQVQADDEIRADDKPEDVKGHVRTFERPEDGGTETPPSQSPEDLEESEDDVAGHSFLQMLPGIEGRADGEPL